MVECCGGGSSRNGVTNSQARASGDAGDTYSKTTTYDYTVSAGGTASPNPITHQSYATSCGETLLAMAKGGAGEQNIYLTVNSNGGCDLQYYNPRSFFINPVVKLIR